MKAKWKSLHRHVWGMLLLFSCFIILFLWLMQVLLFDTYYESYKRKELKKNVYQIEEMYGEDDFYQFLDTLSYDEGICIDIEKNGYISYRNASYNRGCMVTGTHAYQTDFAQSEETIKTYRIVNTKFNNNILVYGIRLDSHTFAFVSASLEPLDAATRLLKKQFIILSIVILILSFILSYYLSKKISNPITAISKKTTAISHGEYSEFHSNSNIGEIQELEKNLNDMQQEFAKTDELRRDLMANVSHDLKTPLTMIKAYAEMVRDLTYADKKKREENLNVIVEESDRLSNLVDDILTLSSMQAETIPLELSTFSLNEMIRAIIQKYNVLLEKEHYIFQYEEVPVMVEADYKRTEQVIFNLINNAINYTGEDNTVMIRTIVKKDTVRVEIEDTGKGIAADEIEHIWTKYYHSSKKHKRNKIGTGLGLSIVKNILDGYHLPYGVESNGKGATFYFELSLASQKDKK